MSTKKYICTKCKQSFSNQGNLTKHMKKTNPCVQNKEYKCPKCKKIYARKDHYLSHMNRKTPCVIEIKDTSTTADNEENKCKYCGNKFAHKYSLKRHYKSCKAKNNPNIMEQRFKEMTAEISELSALIKTQQPVVNNYNQTFNDNRQINITLVNFGSEDLSRIPIDDICRTFQLSAVDDIIPGLIKLVHCNDQIPEHHNIYISKNDDDTVMVYSALPEDPTKQDWIPSSINVMSPQLTENVKSLFMARNIPKQEFSSIIDEPSFAKLGDVIEKKGDTDEEQQKIKEVLYDAKELIT